MSPSDEDKCNLFLIYLQASENGTTDQHGVHLPVPNIEDKNLPGAHVYIGSLKQKEQKGRSIPKRRDKSLRGSQDEPIQLQRNQQQQAQTGYVHARDHYLRG